MVLRAQLSDWQTFRAIQRNVRHCYRKRPFNEFLDRVCERQRRHKFQGKVHLQLDVKQQSQLENWIEFRDWQFRRYQELEKGRDDFKKSWEDSRKGIEVPGAPRFAPELAGAYQRRLKYEEWKVERHKTLLEWIDQQRIAMDIGYSAPLQNPNIAHIAEKASAKPAPTADSTARRRSQRIQDSMHKSSQRHKESAPLRPRRSRKLIKITTIGRPA